MVTEDALLRLEPLIVTRVPTGPLVGEKLLIEGGGGRTIKPKPLLGTPLTVTTTFPEVAPTGTFTVIEVSLQPVMSPARALVPLKLTEFPLDEAPKLVPVMVTAVATGAELGEMFV